ncbi:Family of unknown function (DUF572) [Babesia microti strain RI]|uniref:Coiled-coil domain-containing protein 130 n=1 Tax=Babesia microti (strain RI) TaxID=1133968 RepID=A0A0K3AV27_BABMR|nr:Family of unknown function (DUF572) [Babesia microti strain RI]CTQ41456.1 Family of unknown function (DUF572) [Babesia microti strain RI]|eukprot:XP_012649467.1 Family of unknown function (DUF572) [Babesia microti strain RI]
MSTLKAARADNFYYAPDTENPPERKIKRNPKPKNHFTNILAPTSSIYSESARPDGSLIRFEMPFKIICTKCNEYIAKGVRFNAKRREIGMHYTTVIYSFTIYCKSCTNPIVIETDPENTEYVVKIGARRKVDTFDTKDAGTLTLGATIEEKQLLATNPMFRLEHQLTSGNIELPEIKDKTVNADEFQNSISDGVTEKQRITMLQTLSNARSGDSYIANYALRRKFRQEKKALIQDRKRLENFSLPLADPVSNDVTKQISFVSENKKMMKHINTMVKCKGNSLFGVKKTSCLGKKKQQLEVVRHIASKIRTRI